jgi:acetyltransferase
MQRAQIASEDRNSPRILFSFNSVVVVGASDDPTRIGGAPIFLLKKYGYAGKIYGLNPKYSSIQGLPCFAEPEDIRGSVDVAIFCVAAERIRNLLPRLKRKGLKGAVIFSAGFRESGEDGKDLQNWLTEYARGHRIAILGPNCVGQISFSAERSLTFANAFLTLPVTPAGRVALLSQSGGIATNIWADALLAGTRFSHVITTGNEADLGFDDYLNYLADDDKTDVVIGYIEALKDGPEFCIAAERMRANGKPLVLIKVGTSAAGRDAVSSHTGQLSSDDAGYQAAFDRHGVIRVSSLEELNDYARVFSLGRIKPKATAATTTGGAGVYVADLCADLGIEMSTLSAKTEAALGKIVPSYGRIRNPVDLTAQVVNDISILKASLKILLDDPETGVLLFLLSGKGTPEQSAEVISVMKEVQAEAYKKIILCWLGVPEEVRRRGSDAGLIVYQDPARFLRPLKGYFDAVGTAVPARLAQAREKAQADKEEPEAPQPAIDFAQLRKSFEHGADGRLLLTERRSMELLEQFGVDCPRRWYARSADNIAKICEQTSYPCVMKIAEPVVAHKSDVGGVVIGIASPAELLAAWTRIADRLKAREVMVVEQVAQGMEVLVGCLRDETFGMRVTVASGGVWTNFISDTVTLIPPFTESYIRSVLPKLTIWEPMTGARGQQALAVDELVRTVAGIVRLGWALRHEVREFECNPVMVTAKRAVAVDAIGFI